MISLITMHVHGCSCGACWVVCVDHASAVNISRNSLLSECCAALCAFPSCCILHSRSSDTAGKSHRYPLHSVHLTNQAPNQLSRTGGLHQGACSSNSNCHPCRPRAALVGLATAAGTCLTSDNDPSTTSSPALIMNASSSGSAQVMCGRPPNSAAHTKSPAHVCEAVGVSCWFPP